MRTDISTVGRKPLAPPHVMILKLDNGLTVWLVPEAGFPKVAFTLAVRGGYTANPKAPPPVHNGKAYWIKLSAQQDGSFTVTNARNGFSKTYGAGL